MKKIILLIVFIIIISVLLLNACKRQEEKTEGSFTIQRHFPEPKPPELKPGDFEELHFSPPKEGEEIIAEKASVSFPKKNKILIYKKSKEKKELLFTIMPETNFYYIRKNNGNIYFTMEDDDIYNDPQNDLWEIEVKNGVIKNTHIRIGKNFKFSKDGNYLCYIYNDYKHFKDLYKEKLEYDIVKLLEFASDKTYIFDFFNLYPSTRDAGCKIKFIQDRFSIEYIGDGAGIHLKGYILLSDKKFYPTEE